MQRLSKTIAWIVLAWCSIPAMAQEQHAFSVQQAIDYAKKNNVKVKNALLDVQIQQQDNRATTSQALPNVSGSAGLTDYLKIPTTLLPGEFFGQPAGTYIPVKFGTKYNASGAVNLEQVLFDGQVFVGLQARKTSIDYRQKAVDITDEEIRANIYKVYYQLVVSKAQMDQIDANIAKTTKLLKDNTAMFENGFIEKLDVDKASVQLANLQTEKEKAQANTDNGYLGLKLLLGMPIKDGLVLTDTITDSQLKEGMLDKDTYQYSDRNDYQALQLNEKLNEFNIKRYKLSYIPTVKLNANYSKQAQRTKFDIFGNGAWFTTSYIGLNISVPIFDGFFKDANIKKAKLQLRQTQNQLDNLKISIDNDVAKANNTFKSSIHALDYQKKNMELAERVYDQTKKKNESGLASSTDLTNAQNDWRIAQNNYINAMYDAIIAKIDYLKATGKLK